MNGASVGNLKATFAGLSSAIGISTTALASFLGVAGGIAAITILYNVFVDTFDEVAEKAQKSAQEYETVQSKIESLNAELDSTNSKIDELQAKGSLNLVDSQELSNLQAHKELLESDLAIQEKLAELKKGEAAKDAENALTNKGFGVFEDASSFEHSLGNDILYGSAYYENVDIIELTTRKQKELNEEQENYNQLVKEFGSDSQSAQNSQSKITRLQGEIAENWEQIIDLQQNVSDPEILNRIEELNLLILGESGEIAKKQAEIDSFLSKPTLSKLVDDAKYYAEAMNGITVDNLINQFPELANAAKNAGFELIDIVNAINSEVGTLNFDEVRSQLRNALTPKNMPELNAWSEWIDGLSNDELKILYGIYQSKDTSAWSFQDWKTALEDAKNVTEEFETTIDSVLSKPTLQKSVDIAKSLAKELGGISADTIIAQFPELASAAEAAGFQIQDVVDAINEMIDGIDFVKAKEQIRDAVNFVPNGSAGDFKLMESWDAWVSSLNNEQIKILYGIYQSTDTSAWSFEDWKIALSNAENDANASTNKIASDVDKITSSISKAQSLLSSQSAGKSISLADFNSEELKDYTSALENNNGTLQLNAEKVREIVQAKADEESAIIATNKAMAQSEYLKNASEIEQLRQKLIDKNFAEGESVDSINAEIDALLESNSILKNRCDQYNIMSQSLREATDAYHNWLNAQSSSDYGDMFDDSMNAYQRIMDTYNSDSDIFGQFGSKKFDAAVEFWIPDTVSSDNIDNIKSYMDSVSKYLTFDDNNNATGLNIEKLCDDAVSNGLMVFDEASQEYRIAGQMTMEQFAEGMNLSLPVVQAFFDQMQLYGGDFSWADEANKTIGDLAVSATEAAESLRTKLHDLGMEDYEINIDVSDLDNTEDKISALDKTIAEMQSLKGYVSIDSTEAQEANDIIAYCIRQKQMLTQPTIMQVDSSSLSNTMNEAIGKLQEFQSLANDIEVQKAVGLDTSSAETQLESLRGEISGINPNILAALGIDPTSIETTNETINAITPEMLVNLGINEESIIGYEAPDKEATVKYDADTTIPDEYHPEDKDATVHFDKESSEPDTYDPKNLSRTVTFDRISWDVDSYNPKNLTRTVTYRIKTVGSVGVNGTAHVGGTAKVNGTAAAGGDWGTAQGGMTLVGELGREIVVDPYTGRWYTVGDTGAEFAYVPKGAIVFNHKQTEALLANGYVTGRASSALASGTAMVTGGIKKQYASYTNGGTYNSNNQSSNYSSSSYNSSSSVNSYDFESLYKYHQHLLNMDQENVADYIAWLDKAYQEAYKNGEIELDDYYKYQEEVFEKVKSMLDDVRNEHENAITLTQNWLDNAIADGDRGKISQYTSEIVAHYKAMQEELHKEAEYYRSLGYSDTSDEVSKLSDLWWEYQNTIKEVIVTAYEDIVSECENAITLTENWLNQAIESANYSDISRYTNDIIGYYRDMQDTIHDEAEYYRSLGYADTSEEVSKLSDLWWDYQDAIVNATKDAWQQVVDNANDALDNIQGMYDSLKDAAQEYAEYGSITVDTLQDILSYGVENLAYLHDENGQLVINEKNIQRVIAARTQQMAIETALNYIQQLRTALTNNDTAALLNLTTATSAAASSTWDLVYAQLQLLGLSDDQYNNALQRINVMRSLADSAVTSIGRIDTSAKEALEETSSALEDLLKYVEDMVKQEVENQIDALEKQIED